MCCSSCRFDSSIFRHCQRRRARRHRHSAVSGMSFSRPGLALPLSKGIANALEVFVLSGIGDENPATVAHLRRLIGGILPFCLSDKVGLTRVTGTRFDRDFGRRLSPALTFSRDLVIAVMQEHQIEPPTLSWTTSVTDVDLGSQPW